nr:MAG TPA: hypothetical protein [Caudoviricetes sp.]
MLFICCINYIKPKHIVVLLCVLFFLNFTINYKKYIDK